MFNLLFTQLTNNINIAYTVKKLLIKSNYFFYYEIINIHFNSGFITEENEKVLNDFIFIIKKNIKK